MVGLPPAVEHAVREHPLMDTLVAALGRREDPARGRARARTYRGPQSLTITPQVLYRYPADSRKVQYVENFCFPSGIEPSLVRRTPSLSSIMEVVFGDSYRISANAQHHIFVLASESQAPTYGVCITENELVHILPQVVAGRKAKRQPHPPSKFWVTAPRCYCLLSPYPFFDLHFHTLTSILAQEKLERTAFWMETQLHLQPGAWGGPGSAAGEAREGNGNGDTGRRPNGGGLGRGSDDGLPKVASKGSEITVTEHFDDGSSTSSSESEAEGDQSFTLFSHAPSKRQHRPHHSRTESIESGNISVLSTGGDSAPEDPEDPAEGCASHTILREYRGLGVPPAGSTTTYRPLPTSDEIVFRRGAHGPFAGSSWQGLGAVVSDEEVSSQLSAWTTAAMCRSLALENILTLLQAALLEKRVVVFCPNLSVLSAVTLGTLVLLRPFVWQSILLPVLPAHWQEFLEAPVPFIVGVQHKSVQMRLKAHDCVRVNVYKDKVKAPNMAPMPGLRRLGEALGPVYQRLRDSCLRTDRQAVHELSAEQQELTGAFVQVVNEHLEGLVENLQSFTITDVQNDEKISLVLKDSFLASFGKADRPFMGQFLETQMFEARSDALLQKWNRQR